MPFSFKKPIVLIVLFLLPVLFLLMLYPSRHNYKTLDAMGPAVDNPGVFTNLEGTPISVHEHLTVLGFLGTAPLDQAILNLNLKELVYDKFRGFKRFQIIMIAPNSAKEDVKKLKKEMNYLEPLEYWEFAFGSEKNIQKLFLQLNSRSPLAADWSSNYVYILDKQGVQRGRIDDRSKTEIEQGMPIHSLQGYNCLEVAELKNKMSEDMRILFTEYRQKRKGTFNSTTRRANDLKTIKN
jgi:hypothetical protein